MIINAAEPGEYRLVPHLGKLMVQDSHLNHYKSGKFFIQYLYENLLGALVAHMQRNVRDDFDNVVVVDGLEGVGKSSFTWTAAEMYQPGFDFERQLTYSAEELRQKLNQGDDQHGVFWLDEAYDIANKREWQTEKNQTMVKNLVKMRSRHWTLYMDIPRMEDLDVYIREHRARYWITCEYGMEFDGIGYLPRGVFHLRIRNRKTGYWDECGYGLFPDMPPEVKKIYHAYKTASQDKDLREEAEPPTTKYKKKYETERRRLAKTVRILRNMGLPVSDILKQLGINRKQYEHLMELSNSVDEIAEEDD